MKITNCHIHTFISDDIPNKFLPLGLVRWIARRDHPVAGWILHHLNPFSSKDAIDRYLEFIKTGKSNSQKEVFNKVKVNYPIGTRFIVLPMDMAFMGAGKVPRNYYDQLEEISAQLPSTAINFIHVDPRRSDIFRNFVTCVETMGFKGMKLYPPLGVYPQDKRLDVFYEYCQKKGLPVLAHGSPGSPVHYKGPRRKLYELLGIVPTKEQRKMKKKDLCSIFTDPNNYHTILNKYPKLNICIAHFGSFHWDKYIDNDFKDNWVVTIIKMVEMYNNFWVDISYTMSNKKYWPALKLLLLTNDKLRLRVLFGSDFYMNEVEGTEKEWSMDLRLFLGEDLFKQIAEINPKKYLYENK